MTLSELRSGSLGRSTRAACALLLGAVIGATHAASLHGYDPLSDDEQQQAIRLTRADTRASELLAHAHHVEVLFAERHEEAKGSPAARRADVYIYLYDSDRLLAAVVDLGGRKVDSLRTEQNVQLPPTDAENASALALALADPTSGKAIREEYQRVTGEPSANAEAVTGQQLTDKALVFRADAHPAAAAAANAQACGIHRCVQLLLTTHDGVLVNLMPIVDLSRGTVAGIVPFVGA